MDIREELARRVLLFDGGMGTMLQAAGLPAGHEPELWNLERPDAVRAVHAQYLAAGADIVTTNTFGANAVKLSGHPVEEVVTAGVTLARQAVDAHGGGFVALDLGPTGRLLRPMGDLDFEDAVSAYAPAVRAGAAARADLVLIETMSDLYEAKAAVLSAKENCDLPVFVSVTLDETGRMLTGGDLSAAVALLEGLGVDALGVNCGLGPAQMLPIVKQLLEYASVPLVVNPNAGLPHACDGCTVFDVGPAEFARHMGAIADLGVQILGGCCGTTPDHIRAAADLCRDKPFTPAADKGRTLVSSYAQAVEIGPTPVVIGERINPTGKKKFQQALRDHNIEYLLNEAFAQEEAGAQVLDVNVGLPGIDEPALLTEVMESLQAVLPLPLQLDTSDPEAMERAMRRYNGKPMLNSVSGKAESMAALFPLVKKYGGVVVGLALDEKGIPPTAEGRLAIARKICDTAAQYGIPRKELVIDPLTLTISSEPEAAKVTLEAVGRIRRELGVSTILGVSNVSFGLPRRELVNTAFFTMALQQGLDCAILNPNNAAMMGAWRSYQSLMGLDSQCGRYIAAYSGQEAPAAPASAGEGPSLADCVLRGSKEGAAQAAQAALDSGKAPLELVDSVLIPALDQVGQGFEQGTLFLPQLLMSAEAAKAAFAVVQNAMSGEDRPSQGTVVLATVKGDIHDIGKNIVKVLLENYSFTVIDLGRDVSPERIVEAAGQPGVKLVGLSALMTTTVVSMEETIRQLRENCPQAKIVVGGAVLTPAYAAQIGADRYAKDAMATVRYAKEVYC